MLEVPHMLFVWAKADDGYGVVDKDVGHERTEQGQGAAERWLLRRHVELHCRERARFARFNERSGELRHG
jgi:hypothetical protein